MSKTSKSKKTTKVEKNLNTSDYKYEPAKSLKDIAAEYLVKKGFTAQHENGVLMIYFKPGVDITELSEMKKQVQKYLKEINYNASWGLCPKQNKEFVNN